MTCLFFHATSVEVESIYSGVELDLGLVIAMVIFSSPQASNSPSGGCCYIVLRVGPGVPEGFSQCSCSTLLAWITEGSILLNYSNNPVRRARTVVTSFRSNIIGESGSQWWSWDFSPNLSCSETGVLSTTFLGRSDLSQFCHSPCTWVRSSGHGYL